MPVDKIKQIKVNKFSLFVASCYLFFLVFNILYYSTFTVEWEYYSYENNYEPDSIFYYVLNGDTYKAYYHRLLELISQGFHVLSNWSHAIAYIYYFIWLIFRFEISDVFLIAFLINNIAIVISYLYFVKIGREIIGLKMRWRGLYFLNPTLIYISQLMSKEALLIALVTALCYYSIKRKYMIIFIFSSITGFVRAPFALLGAFPIVLKGKDVRIYRFLFLTILFYLVIGYFYSNVVPNKNSIKILENAGVTRLAFEWNSFYLGPLMMAPLKLLGNFYDLVRHAFFYSIQQGRIDLYHATTIPITIALLAQYKMLFYIGLNPFKALRSANGHILLFILGYGTLLSANQYVHSRYLWPILPLFVLLLIGIKKTRLKENSMLIKRTAQNTIET
jgi:hypothetical protein